MTKDEKVAMLRKAKEIIEGMVDLVADVYDPDGTDESMGGSVMLMNNAHCDLADAIDEMIASV